MEHGCTCTWIFFSLLAKALRRTHDISKYDCHILLLAKRAYGEILIRALIILKNIFLNLCWVKRKSSCLQCCCCNRSCSNLENKEKQTKHILKWCSYKFISQKSKAVSKESFRETKIYDLWKSRWPVYNKQQRRLSKKM